MVLIIFNCSHTELTKGMNDTKFYGNVLPEPIRVKKLETSIMGIGSPLKAIVIFMPYLVVFLKVADNDNFVVNTERQ